MNVHFSRQSDEWATPRKLYDILYSFYNFTLDAAASSANALCPKYYTIEDDGLTHSWAGEHAVWCNPPYSQLLPWVEKCWREGRNTTVVMLIPARTDTIAWQTYILPHANEIHFIEGRLKFGESRNSAPFPSALVIFRPSLKNIVGEAFCTRSRVQ